jgi:hypothetical protein
MPSPDLLVFVHIEKCAGTAVNVWLSASHRLGNLYVKSSSIPMTSLRWTDVRPADLVDVQMRSVASHHLRTYPNTVEGRTLHYFTLLRDPVARWISYVRYFRLLGPAQPDGGGGNLSLREYAESILAEPAAMTLTQLNGQTNHVAAHEWFRMHHDDAVAIDWGSDAELFAQYRRERLAFAKESLGRFGALGTVERLSESTRVLRSRAAAWDVPLLPVDGLLPTHVTDAAPVDAAWITPHDSVGRRLLEALGEDFELYRYAGERLTADLAGIE